MKISKIALFIILIFIILPLNCYSQKLNVIKLDSLFNEFKKNSFYASIYPAKKELENYQIAVIPKLIKLLSDTTFVKLKGTADLIYPGTTTYYGHGHYIPYNMDWISIRSGWLLEDLTFQDFGYKNSEVNDETLMKLMKENYYDYINNGTYELDWKNKTSQQKNIEYKKILFKKTEKWWKENRKKWNRISAIKEALKSNNENRLSNVFQYLRFGNSKCDNLTKEIYLKEIEPLILVLKEANTYPEIQEQIKLILSDSVNSKILDNKI
ncbi:hypothetical protein IRZ71_06725 [Flavobacterium sp. ANB]|uniref:hypothetical protein n=1 Tax=unclassified Flavobacterium TaxID=196869 RepID=UPI0012B8BAE3|nr:MULTISPECIES: hypothetical protein [unclassified Flavobacterium]MBF4516027.1 hypothetical protein [Flavobacterium sp. ANB]MTD69029.1 hypothetical protein [Flavobacterium sp. LC2016-13]